MFYLTQLCIISVDFVAILDFGRHIDLWAGVSLKNFNVCYQTFTMPSDLFVENKIPLITHYLLTRLHDVNVHINKKRITESSGCFNDAIIDKRPYKNLHQYKTHYHMNLIFSSGCTIEYFFSCIQVIVLYIIMYVLTL